GLDQRWPDELDVEQDEDRKRQHLAEQGDIDIHVVPCGSVSATASSRGVYSGADGIVRATSIDQLSAASSGVANANIIATPTPIRNAASIRPASRNMRPCNIGTSSGWRAADSRNFEPMMPMPSAAPSAPRPTMMPMAMAVKAWTLAMNSMVYLLGYLKTKLRERRGGGVAWLSASVELVRNSQVEQRH